MQRDLPVAVPTTYRSDREGDLKKSYEKRLQKLETDIQNILTGPRSVLSYTNMLKDKIVENQYTIDKNLKTIERLEGPDGTGRRKIFLY